MRIQIWTALLAILLVKHLQLRATYTWSLSNLVALQRLPLFVYRDLMGWANRPFPDVPEADAGAPVQLVLDWAI